MSVFETKTLDDVCDRAKPFPIVDGPFGTQLRAEEYKPEGVPLVRVTNLSFDGRFKPEELVFISDEKAAEVRRSEVTRNDLIVAKTGATIGKCGLFPFDRGVIASSCIKISVDTQKVDPRFLLHRVVSPEGQTAILDGASGSTRTTINIGPFKQIRFPFPSPSEQSRIAAVLDTVDKAIAKTEAVIAKVKQVRAGLLHDLLTRGLDENGQLRDPVAHRDQFKDSPLGRIPRKWSLETFGERLKHNAGTIQTGPFGSQLHAHEYRTEGVPVIMPQDIREGNFDDTRIARIPLAKAEELRRHRVRWGDLIFARRGDLSRCAAVAEREVGWLCGTGCLLVRFEQGNLSTRWLSLACRHDFGQRQIAARAVGTTMVNLNTTLLAHLVFAFPPKEEQEEIVRRIDGADATIEKELANRSKFGLLKCGLMNDLLTGRVRVPENIMDGLERT